MAPPRRRRTLKRRAPPRRKLLGEETRRAWDPMHPGRIYNHVKPTHQDAEGRYYARRRDLDDEGLEVWEVLLRNMSGEPPEDCSRVTLYDMRGGETPRNVQLVVDHFTGKPHYKSAVVYGRSRTAGGDESSSSDDDDAPDDDAASVVS